MNRAEIIFEEHKIELDAKVQAHYQKKLVKSATEAYSKQKEAIESMLDVVDIVANARQAIKATNRSQDMLGLFEFIETRDYDDAYRKMEQALRPLLHTMNQAKRMR